MANRLVSCSQYVPNGRCRSMKHPNIVDARWCGANSRYFETNDGCGCMRIPKAISEPSFAGKPTQAVWSSGPYQCSPDVRIGISLDATGAARGFHDPMVTLGLLSIGERERCQSVVECRALADISRDHRGVARLGVGQCQRPAAQRTVFGETLEAFRLALRE